MTGPRKVHRKFLLHPPGTERQQYHAIAQPCCFAHVVRNENDGAAGFSPDAFQFVVQQIASLSVQRRKRLVHQQDVGLGGQRSRQCDSLPHAARELMDVALPEFRKMHQAQIVLHLLLALVFADVLHLHAELDVPANCQPRKQAEFLEDQDAIGSRPTHRRAIHQHLSRGLRTQARDQVQQRGLATSRRTDNAEKLSRLHFQADVVERQ